jgi:glycosyltransferase involved in cell wall biosynthesis
MATGSAISVIMSVYNGAPHIHASVQSILQQNFTDFELLILNDGSTDSSSEILNALTASDSRIRLIERENRGLVASLNELIAAAKSPLLARMDSDDIAMPDRLGLQFAYLKANPQIGILGSNTHDLDENGFLQRADEKYPLSPQDARLSLRDGPPVCHPSVMMRTDIIRALGGYRAAFRHAEDYDLWLRASLVTDISNLPQRLLLYRRSPQQISQKHAAEQAKAAAIAWLDHVRCGEGRASLFDHMPELPHYDALDALFGNQSSSAYVRRKVVERMRYSNEMLKGPEFSMMLQQVRAGEGFEGVGRTILRLGRKGRMLRAVVLASAAAGVLISGS